jgi:hypothetical protein
MEPHDRITRERYRIDALHDAVAIIIAEIGQKDIALRDAIVHRFRIEEQKAEAEYPPDERGMRHALPNELSTLCESIERYARSSAGA